MSKNQYVLLNENHLPENINLQSQTVNGKILGKGKYFPKYHDLVTLEDIENTYTWTNAYVYTDSQDFNTTIYRIYGKLQKIYVHCKTINEVCNTISSILRLIDERKNWNEYESSYIVALNNEIISKIAYVSKLFVFDMHLLPKGALKCIKNDEKKINAFVRSLPIETLRLSGKFNIEIPNNKVCEYQFRDSYDLNKIMKSIKEITHPIILRDINDQGLLPSEETILRKTKLNSTNMNRLNSIVSKLQSNDYIIQFKCYIRIDQIHKVIESLKHCKKIYCLISNNDISEKFAIERHKFNTEQEKIARLVETNYPMITFKFLANRIYDHNQPPDFTGEKLSGLSYNYDFDPFMKVEEYND